MKFHTQVTAGIKFGLECFQAVISLDGQKTLSPVFLSEGLARNWIQRYVQDLKKQA